MYIEAKRLDNNKIEIIKIEDSYPGFLVYEDDAEEIFIAMNKCVITRNKIQPRSINITLPGRSFTAYLTADDQIKIFDTIVKAS